MNFWPEDSGEIGFIGASLEALAQECPPAYQAMCSQMAGRSLWLQIGEQAVILHFWAGQVELQAAPEVEPAPDLRLRTDPQTILDLAAARLTLIEAVFAGRLDLFCPAKDLPGLYEAILSYLRGAVRCPSFPLLLEQFKVIHTASREGR